MTPPLLFTNAPEWKSPREIRPEIGGRPEQGLWKPPAIFHEPPRDDGHAHEGPLAELLQLPPVRRLFIALAAMTLSGLLVLLFILVSAIVR